MIISTGTAEHHPSFLAVDTAATPATAGLTVTGHGGVEVPARDLTGERLQQLAADQAAIAQAQQFGTSAETDRRAGYDQDVRPAGSMYGEQLELPPVPEASGKHTGGDDSGYPA